MVLNLWRLTPVIDFGVKIAERTEDLEPEICDRQKIQEILKESEEKYQLTLKIIEMMGGTIQVKCYWQPVATL